MPSDFFCTRVFKPEQYLKVLQLKTGLIFAHDEESTLLWNPQSHGSEEHVYQGPIIFMEVSPNHLIAAVYAQEEMPCKPGEVQHWIHRKTLLTLDPGKDAGIPPFMDSIRLDSAITSLAIDNLGNVTIIVGNTHQNHPVKLSVYKPPEEHEEHRESA